MAFFEDFPAGRSSRSEERHITADDVLRYALLTGDVSPIHIDDRHATATSFGRRIVHGTFVFAVSRALAPPPGADLRILRIRFHNPVFVGDSIAVLRTVGSADAETSTITLDYSVVTGGDVLAATWSERVTLPKRPGAQTAGT
jgi:3-hydroxybutyryl-CoA dehydratase